jgi:hypothetical protein
MLKRCERKPAASVHHHGNGMWTLPFRESEVTELQRVWPVGYPVVWCHWRPGEEVGGRQLSQRCVRQRPGKNSYQNQL